MIVDAHVHVWAEGWRPQWNQDHALANAARARGISLDEAQEVRSSEPGTLTPAA